MRLVTAALLWIPAALAVAAGGAVSDSSEQPVLPVVSGQGFNAAIVPRLVNFEDSWTPTQSQVRDAEPIIQQFVISQRPRLRSTLSGFFRQYSGTTFGGKQYLWVDFFDTRHFKPDDLKYPLVVLDGDGESYFVVWFNLESRKCSFSPPGSG